MLTVLAKAAGFAAALATWAGGEGAKVAALR